MKNLKNKDEDEVLEKLSKSWISFDTEEVEEQISLEGLDPLLFALQAYLLGDDMAKLVRIAEIRE